MDVGVGEAPLPPGPPPGMVGGANQPTPLPAGPPPGGSAPGNKLLVVEGLPEDGTSRELTQLFRFLPGFVTITEVTKPITGEGARMGFPAPSATRGTAWRAP